MPLFVWGYSVTPEGARRLVATLLVVGTPEARSAAAAIDRALNDDGGLVGLGEAERDALFFALEDDGGDEQVAELRGALSRDHRHRWGDPPVE